MRKGGGNTEEGERILKEDLREVPRSDWKYFSGGADAGQIEDPDVVAYHEERRLHDQTGMRVKFL